MDMRKYICGAVRAVPAALWGGAALAETEIILSDAGVTGRRGRGGGRRAPIAIAQSGSYRLTGTMSEGSISVEADDVELIWDGAQLACSTDRAADRARGSCVLTLAENGSVTISDLRRARRHGRRRTRPSTPEARSPFRGEGALTVVGQAGHGLRAAGAARSRAAALSVLAGGDGAHLDGGGGRQPASRSAGGQLTARRGRPRRLRGRRRAHRGGDLRLESERGRPLRGRQR